MIQCYSQSYSYGRLHTIKILKPVATPPALWGDYGRVLEGGSVTVPKNWNSTSALVTGAAGLIGSHLVDRLAALGTRTRALVQYNSAGSWGGWRPHQCKGYRGSHGGCAGCGILSERHEWDRRGFPFGSPHIHFILVRCVFVLRAIQRRRHTERFARSLEGICEVHCPHFHQPSLRNSPVRADR